MMRYINDVLFKHKTQKPATKIDIKYLAIIFVQMSRLGINVKTDINFTPY